MRPSLDLVVQERITPGASLAADRAALARAAARRDEPHGVLRVYDCAARLLSLGRYHLAPAAAGAPAGGVRLARRLSGGRVAPAGEGFVGIALALPHRSALVSADPLALGPEQVMNRCVRGVLAGLERGGVAAFYPGRDLVTVGGRVLGVVSFEVDERGACLFEAVLANGGDLGALPALLDAVDPGGVVPAELLGPQACTSLVREAGRIFAAGEVAALVGRGYAERLGAAVAPGTLPAEDADDAAWVARLVPRADLDRRASRRGQLGVVQVALAVVGDRIAEAVFSGDLIAGSPTVAALEAALRGAPASAGAVRDAVARVLAAPGHFVLGLGPADALADLVVEALGR